MKIDEARLYLEHTSRDDFNLEEHQIENRYEAIKVVLEEIERLNNIINRMDKEIDNLCKNQKKEIERLHSIIKEVKEYITTLENIKINYVLFEEEELYASRKDFVKDILEILDKENI